VTAVSTSQSFSVTEHALDVTDAVSLGEPCSIGCSLFVPDELGDRPTIVVAQPGGTYRRDYYDLQPPGRSGYSQARYFAERGIVFAALDYLGGGDSTRPADGDRLTLPVLADAAHGAFLALRDGLRGGTLGAPPMPDAIFVGLGFSFGGGITILHQGRYGDYDAMMIYGYSPLAADAHEGYDIPENWDALSEAERREIVSEANTRVVGGELPVYHGAPRFGAWRSHYLRDTDEELITYDEEQLQTLVPRMAGIDVMTHGFALPFAQRIECPVFLAFAEQDVVADPRVQARGYPRSYDIALSVIPNARHLVNFLDSRYILWDRTLAWLTALPALLPTTR
jgi:alpha-beta hydrolase superfamily lysophospholipase